MKESAFVGADSFSIKIECKFEVTIQPPSKRIPFLGVFVNDM